MMFKPHGYQQYCINKDDLFRIKRTKENIYNE